MKAQFHAISVIEYVTGVASRLSSKRFVSTKLRPPFNSSYQQTLGSALSRFWRFVLLGVPAMPIGKPLAPSVFDDNQVHVLTEAFEEALRLTDITDRTSWRAEAIADRIIATFGTGERDPKQIARAAVEN